MARTLDEWWRSRAQNGSLKPDLQSPEPHPCWRFGRIGAGVPWSLYGPKNASPLAQKDHTRQQGGNRPACFALAWYTQGMFARYRSWNYRYSFEVTVNRLESYSWLQNQLKNLVSQLMLANNIKTWNCQLQVLIFPMLHKLFMFWNKYHQHKNTKDILTPVAPVK